MEIEDTKINQRVLDHLETINNNITSKIKSQKKHIKEKSSDTSEVMSQIIELVDDFENKTQGHNYGIPMSFLKNQESEIDSKDWQEQEYATMVEMPEYVSYKKKSKKLNNVIEILITEVKEPVQKKVKEHVAEEECLGKRELKEIPELSEQEKPVEKKLGK